jgi:hypothetical protein
LRGRLSSAKELVAAGLGIALLMVAWLAATAPFGAPDEAPHYLRALGIANGQLLGPRVPLPRNLNLPPAQFDWAQQDTRGVVTPALISPPNEVCVGGAPITAARSCVEPTNTGDYQPLPYLLPALALAAAHDVNSGLWLARIASALPCLAFLLLALVLLAVDARRPPIGVLLALTPTVLFVGSVINPNGLEIASSLAFLAALLRIARSPARSPSWVWTALLVSAVVAVLSWQLGPVFAVLDVLLVLPALGREGISALWGARARRLRWTGATLAAAFCVWLVYSTASGLSHAGFSPFPLIHSLRLGAHQLWIVLHQAIGDFGTLTIPLPSFVDWSWWLVVLVLVGWALVLGGRRERWWTAGTVVIAVAFPVVFYAWVFRLSGFGLQGRYVVPVLMVPALVAGEVVRAHWDQVPTRVRRWLPAGLLAIVAVIQLFAWDLAARHAAGRPGSVWFLGDPGWRPPLGWWPWALCALLGTLALASAAVLRARSD